VAKVMVDAGDVPTAKLQLAWVVDTARTNCAIWRACVWPPCCSTKRPTMSAEAARRGARRRLRGAFADARGDVLGAQGKVAEARAAYQAALTTLDGGEQTGKGKNSLQDRQANAAYREALQLKLDALGEPG
jgi:predicted negative regulator of RcsB-dependent stress response